MDLSESGQPLMDVVLQFLQEDRWHYQKVENKPAVRTGFRGERGTWVCYIMVDEAERRVLIHALMGMNFPRQFYSQINEYITRVNYRLPVGNFEMNLDTGDVRFRTSVEVPDGQISSGQVRALAYTNVRAMDYYFPGVVAVVHSGLSPEAALARVDAQMLESVTGQ
jgi:hypothetical protein